MALTLVDSEKQQKSPTFLRVLAEINKLYPGRLSLGSERPDPPRILTPSFAINRILGGGIPANRLTLISGYSGSFKSTFTLMTLKNLLDLCGDCFKVKMLCQCQSFNDRTYVAYIDVDQTLDRDYFSRLGVDGERVQLFQPPYGEAACEAAERFAQVPEVRGIVVDTLASLESVDELVTETSKKGWMDSIARGLRAKLIARLCRSLITHLNSPVPRLGIMINHVLPLVDGSNGSYLPGGQYQKNLSTVVLKFWEQGKSKSKQSTDDLLDEEDGTKKGEIGFLVEKSKLGQQNISGEFQLYTKGNGEGGIRAGDTDEWKSVADWAVKYGILDKSSDGKYTVENKAYGPQTIVKHWQKNPDEYRKIQEAVIKYEKSSQGW